MKDYDFRSIEAKWQHIWQQEKRYEVKNRVAGKDNFYVLIEFPYPSGKGLHVGHVRSYSVLDAYARKKRLEGYNVLFPMGCDAFGLEAERTAIKEKTIPQNIVKRNIEVFKKQLECIGLSFDWSREISTCDPNYYKWTQWLFLQFFKHGLAEKRETLINWCPNCGVLANEEIVDGRCCQCGEQTEQKPKKQWVLKMTEYADRLADDLDDTEYLDSIKLGQRNWIGKSEGLQITFDVEQGGHVDVFTTCPETIFGVAFLVLAPESRLVQNYKKYIKNWDKVSAYINETKKKSEFDRAEMARIKTGCVLEGIYCINPVNSHRIPVYIGDFVLPTYGTGAVMAVPAHDQRDYIFAKTNGIDFIQVIKGKNARLDISAYEKKDYMGEGTMINSGSFDGLSVISAKEKISSFLISRSVAKSVTSFKMRDWIFSRQRYWGEPIPMIECPVCGWVPVPDKDLPVVLPNVSSYEPTTDGESPLSQIDEWVNVKCPYCGAKAKRETDTMPGWAGSSWYFMRYCDPNNNKEFASMEALKSWLPVNLYDGGNEHTNRHLLYARFWNKFLFDIGLSPVSEPFKSRISHGLILGANGVKMSKSLGNVVDPRTVIDKYGADSLRLWEAFISEYSTTVSWSEEGLVGCYKFLKRVWAFHEKLRKDEEISKDLEYEFNNTIKKVSEDIDNIKFNTAVAALMSLANALAKQETITTGEYKIFLLLLNPFAPHMTEELYSELGFGDISSASWPSYNERILEVKKVEIVVQINSKNRGKLWIEADSACDVVEQTAMELEPVREVKDKIKKTIYVKNRLINFIVKQ